MIMARLRFSIASLLGVVLFAAVGIGALRESTDAWDSGLLALTLLTLLTTVLLAVYRAESARAFWLGFSFFGWTYVMAGLVPEIESRLPTTKGLAYLDAQARRGNDEAAANAMVLQLFLGEGVTQQRTGRLALDLDGRALTATSRGLRWLLKGTGNSENFIRIGHSIVALVLAFAGGHVSRWIYARKKR
jgi:hypothetical protein